MEVDRTEVGGPLWKSCGWSLKFVILVEVGGVCGVYGSSWKLPRNIFVEAAIDGSNGSFHFHRQWKLPCTSMEASTNFHGNSYGSESTSINFHEASMEVN